MITAPVAVFLYQREVRWGEQDVKNLRWEFKAYGRQWNWNCFDPANAHIRRSIEYMRNHL